MNAPPVRQTLPSFPAVDDLAGDRSGLLAGLTFIESAATWSAGDLGRWFQTYAAAIGRAVPPASVTDALSEGSPVPLDATPRARPIQLPRLLVMARWEIILTLRGLLSTPPNDRFLHAAIFAARVRRHRGAWQVEAGDGDSLTQVVLALFAADVLTHREFHEQNLCICDVCGRVSYDPRSTTRAGCADHVPDREARTSEPDSSGVRGPFARRLGGDPLPPGQAGRAGRAGPHRGR